MISHIRAICMMFVALSLLTGAIYPALVTAVAQGIFSHRANGSVVERDGKPVGSELIGQNFTDPRYFWSRPSATADVPYNAASSSGSNLGPTNPALLDAVRDRVKAIRAAHPDQTGAVPADLVTASASGLDPHISPAAAAYQVTRVARARNLSVDEVRQIVAKNTEQRTFGILGEPRVNVVRLNMALDNLAK